MKKSCIIEILFNTLEQLAMMEGVSLFATKVHLTLAPIC